MNLFFDGLINVLGFCTGVPALVALAEDAGKGCEHYFVDRQRCWPLNLAKDIVGIVEMCLVIAFGYVVAPSFVCP